MTGGGDPGPFLSDEEIRELLRDNESPEASDVPPRVLVVARRGSECDFVQGCLVGMECRVSVTRDPFAALDVLRRESPDLVVSDYALWADGGALLFDRIRDSGDTIPVVFLADRDSSAARRPASGGHEHVLVRPLRAEELERAVREMLLDRPGTPAREAAADTTPSGVLSSMSADESSAPPPAEASTTLSGEPTRDREAPDRAPESGSAEWLRFFFHARRACREARARDGRLDRLSMSIDRVLRPRRFVVVLEQPNGSFRLLGRGALSGPGGLVLAPESEIRALLEHAPRASVRSLGASVLSVEHAFEDGSRVRCVLDLAPEVVIGDPELLDELTVLLSEL